MQTVVEYLRTHIGTSVDDDGAEMLRWADRNGLICEAPLPYVVDVFGSAIERAFANSTSIAAMVATGDTDGGWKDVFAWWAESGLLD